MALFFDRPSSYSLPSLRETIAMLIVRLTQDFHSRILGASDYTLNRLRS